MLLLVGFNLAMGLFGLAGRRRHRTSRTSRTSAAFIVGVAVHAHAADARASSSSASASRRCPDADDPPRAIPRTLPRSRERGDEVDEIVAKSKAIAAKRPAAITPARKLASRDLKAEELNRVLDKISAEGLDSLTSDERSVLEEMSRRLREQ